MDSKTCTMSKNEKNINNFYKKKQNVKIVIAQEDWNVTMITKIKFQSNKKYSMKKIEKKYYYRIKTIDVSNLET